MVLMRDTDRTHTTFISLINNMPPFSWPNRVPKRTYDNLKEEYDKLLMYAKNREWEREFFRKQNRRQKFIFITSAVAYLEWMILILISLLK